MTSIDDAAPSPAHSKNPAAARDVDAVGYLVFGTPAWDQWMTFAGTVVRAQIDIQPAGDWARLRIDGKVQRILLEKVTGEPTFAVGLHARDADGLARLAATLGAEGIAVTEGTASEHARRGVRRFFWFNDPDGNRLEAFIGLAEVAGALRTSLPVGGFRTEALGVGLGLGHIVLHTPQIRRMSDFYQRVLKLSLSDFCHDPFEAEFMHMNPRHHSIALLESAAGGIHHIMLEYLEWDDVGRAYDEVLLNPDSIGQTLGRHSNDLVTSFYVFGPDRFMVELGWAGRLVGEDWQPVELMGPSLWGHERYWLPAEKRAVARTVRAKYAAMGIREPVAMPAVTTKSPS